MTARANRVRHMPQRRDALHIVQEQRVKRGPDWLVIGVFTGVLLLYGAWHWGRWHQLQIDQREVQRWQRALQ